MNFREKRTIFTAKTAFGMIITFDKDYLRELYETGKTDKKHRFQPDIVKRYIDWINTLKNKESIEALYNMKSLHYEVLRGNKAGISSIRVNDQYRIEFTVSNQESETDSLYLQYIRIVEPL